MTRMVTAQEEDDDEERTKVECLQKQINKQQ